jgi:hypothetical protein
MERRIDVSNRIICWDVLMPLADALAIRHFVCNVTTAAKAELADASTTATCLVADWHS